ncbi:MAG: radical SAM family heme chaperone HemW [Planctomycetes bacterium]|nr:radical SAM family heme chaperone HemW [Planctomycetota bacterium]
MSRQKGTKPAGLYIHIPFCQSKCGYCSFVMTTRGRGDDQLRLSLLEAIELELIHQLNRYGISQNLQTLYIGGGTPSQLSAAEIDFLFHIIKKHLPSTQWQEITFECNPEDISKRPEIINQLNKHEVSRLSVGIQSMSPKGLSVLDRLAHREQINELTKWLPKEFSGSLSYDFILAWPEQDLAELLKYDIAFLESNQCQHISSYLLNIEEKTKIYHSLKKGRIESCSEDISTSIWLKWQSCLKELDYEHYEISNFCKKGHFSLHNTLTWRGFEYLGVGPGAVSQIGNVRWSNSGRLSYYMDKLKAKKSPVQSAEYLTTEIQWQEALMLGLRHREGLSMPDYHHKHNLNISKILSQDFQELCAKGFLSICQENVKFTEEGWLFFDDIITDLMLKLENSKIM